MNISTLFQFLASAVWLVVVGMIFVMVMRSSRQQSVKGLSTAFIVLIVVAVVLTTVGAGVVFVEPDQLAVVITITKGGIRPDPLQAGIYFVIPYIERVERFSVLRQNYTMSSVADEGQTSGDDSIQVRTKDGQMVYVDATVIYSINPAEAVNLYKTWRNGFQDGLVRPQSRGVIRDVASQYGIEEIVSTKRADMETKITDELTRIFAENNLILQDFVLRNIRFSDEYATAVEQKQIAEQQAQQAKFVVESKKQEAEQARQTAQGQADALVISARAQADARLIQAEAEAKALQLIAEVLKANPNLLQYEYIQKLAPNVQLMLVPSDAPFILPQLGPQTIVPSAIP
jgi:regulator of protease activity HflC (stomatin/prohibitin superfamily)